MSSRNPFDELLGPSAAASPVRVNPFDVLIQQSSPVVVSSPPPAAAPVVVASPPAAPVVPSSPPPVVETLVFGDLFAVKPAASLPPGLSPRGGAFGAMSPSAAPVASPAPAPSSEGLLLGPPPKASNTRTLRRKEMQEKPIVGTIFQQQQPQVQVQQQQQQQPQQQAVASTPSPQPPVVVAQQAAPPVPQQAVPASASSDKVSIVSSDVCFGVRGPKRPASAVFHRGDELSLRIIVAGGSRDPAGRSKLLVRYALAVRGGRQALEQEFVLRKLGDTSLGHVELTVSVPLIGDDVVGPCALQLSVSEEGFGAAQFLHPFEVREWEWSLKQARLLVDGRPGHVPIVYAWQEVGLSAIVTLPAPSQGALVPPEAYYDVRDSATGQSIFSEPRVASLVAHPTAPNCFALGGHLCLSKPGSFVILLAVRHIAHPQTILRAELPFKVEDQFQ